MKYRIECNEDQARIMCDALEAYYRERMGQFMSLPDDVVFEGFNYSEHTSEEFYKLINQRDAMTSVLEAAYKIGCGGYPRTKRTQQCNDAIDIHHVIRYTLWHSHPHEENSYCVDAYEPFGVGQYPLMKCEAIDEQHSDK